MSHTHGKNGVCICAFAETGPPTSNYFAPLNAFAAKKKKTFKGLFSLSLCVLDVISLLYVPVAPLSRQRSLECNSQSLNVPARLLPYYSNLRAKCHGTDHS